MSCGFWPVAKTYTDHVFDLVQLDEANMAEQPPMVSNEEFYNMTLDHTDLMPDFQSWLHSPASQAAL